MSNYCVSTYMAAIRFEPQPPDYQGDVSPPDHSAPQYLCDHSKSDPPVCMCTYLYI